MSLVLVDFKDLENDDDEDTPIAEEIENKTNQKIFEGEMGDELEEEFDDYDEEFEEDFDEEPDDFDDLEDIDEVGGEF